MKHLCKFQVDILINARVTTVQSWENLYTLRDEPFNIYRGVGYQKMTKKIVCRRQKLEKNCLQIVCPKTFCLHGNFKEFANFKISDCSKDAFLLQLTRQHSITFLYKFQPVHISFIRHIIITVFPLTVIIDSTIQQAVSKAACNSKLN